MTLEEIEKHELEQNSIVLYDAAIEGRLVSFQDIKQSDGFGLSISVDGLQHPIFLVDGDIFRLKKFLLDRFKL